MIENYVSINFEIDGVVIWVPSTPCRLAVILGIVYKYISRIFLLSIYMNYEHYQILNLTNLIKKYTTRSLCIRVFLIFISSNLFLPCIVVNLIFFLQHFILCIIVI
jgi:hypothetical protein